MKRNSCHAMKKPWPAGLEQAESVGQRAMEQESTWTTVNSTMFDGGRDGDEGASDHVQPRHVDVPIHDGSKETTTNEWLFMRERLLSDLSDDLTVGGIVSLLDVQDTRTMMLVNRRYRSLLHDECCTRVPPPPPPPFGNEKENDQSSFLGMTVWKEHAVRQWPWLKQELDLDKIKNENGAYSRLHFTTRTASPSQLLAMAQELPHEQHMEVFDVRNSHHAQAIMSSVMMDGESFRRLLQRFSSDYDDSEHIHTVQVVTDETQDWSHDDSATNHPPKTGTTTTTTTTKSRKQRLYFQYRGHIGRGNRCIRANAPLPRPTWPSMTPTLSSLLLDDDDDDDGHDDTSGDNNDTSGDNDDDDDADDDNTTTTTTSTTAIAATTARSAVWPPVFQHFGTVRTMNPTSISCVFDLPARRQNHPAETSQQHLLRPFGTPLLRQRHGTGTIAHIAPRVVSYFEVSILPPIPVNSSDSQDPPNLRPVVDPEQRFDDGTRRFENDPPRDHDHSRRILHHENSYSRINHRTKPDCIAVGIGMNAFAWHCRMPGWDNYSIGYHSDNGGLYCGSGRSIRPTYGPTFGPGDVVGCGIDSIEQTIFFTCNGVFLGDAWQFETAWLQQEETFPVVGLDSHDMVHCNFTGPFVFDLDHYTSERGYEEFIVKAMRPREITKL